MVQPAHILRKDAQHLWPELTLHTVLLIAFAWVVPLGWPPHQPTSFLFQILPAFLHLLLPILWLVIVSRLVHDESLVGDQQFWLTRPYTWTSLLASKLLFLAAFIFLPFLLMQCYLLFHAGLHPLAAIPGLLLNLLYLILICFLPFLVLAAVTSTFPRLALSMISGLIYLIVLALLFAYFTSGQTPPPQALPILATVYAVFSVAVLLFQYARRRILYARVALVALPLVVAFLLLLLPSDQLFRQAYPLASGSPQVSFDSNPAAQEPQRGKLFLTNDKVLVNLPIALSGQPTNTLLEGRAVTFTIDSVGGNSQHYTAPWQSGGLNERVLTLALPEDVLHRFGDQSVRIHVTFAAERLARGTAQTVTLADHFTAPSGGVCFMASEAGNAVCRYAVKDPPITQYMGGYSTVPCFEASDAPNFRPVGSGGINSGPELFFLDPVVQVSVAVSNPQSNRQNQVNTFLCSGIQLSFTQLHSEAKLRFELDVPSVQLSHYVARVPQMPMPMAPQE